MFSYAAGLRRAMSFLQWTLISAGAACMAAAGIAAPVARWFDMSSGGDIQKLLPIGILGVAFGLIFGIVWRRAFRIAFRRKFGWPPRPH